MATITTPPKPNLAPATFELIKNHIPSVKEESDAFVWIARASSVPDVLLKCFTSTHIMQHVVDWKKFTKSLQALISNPYLKDDRGEDPLFYIKIRDQLAEMMDPELKKDDAMLLQKRYSFAAWALWNQSANKGRMYLPLQAIVTFSTRQDLDLDEFYKHVRKHPDGVKGLLLSVDLSNAEQRISEFLQKASATNIKPPTYPSLDKTQNETIASMIASKYAALQGGAGVGKTTTVGCLIQSIVNQPNAPTVFCLAFTHKAKRCIMEKLSGVDNINPQNVRISTIHSFIATYNRPDASIPSCYILIDESSMIDIELLASLADTVMAKCAWYQLAFIGDSMQLPPITRGEFFRQLVSTPGPHVNELHKCYRTDKPDLFDAYQAIRNGNMPSSSPNFEVITVADDKDINSHIGKLIYKYGATLKDKTQFIAWQNKDVYKINQWVQSALLKQKAIGPDHYRGFYKGDKVIYRGENTKALTNAMIGHVTDVASKSMTVKWEDGLSTPVNSDLAKSINLAYALTVHALQGSECENVVIACYEVEKMKYCLDRRFLYTGVSRGKQHVTVVTTPNIKSFLKEPVKAAPLSGVQVA